MKIRVITAVVGIIAVLGLVALGGWFLTSAVFAVSVLSLFEFSCISYTCGSSLGNYRRSSRLLFNPHILFCHCCVLYPAFISCDGTEKRTGAWAYLYRFWRHLSGDRVRFIGISSWRE